MKFGFQDQLIMKSQDKIYRVLFIVHVGKKMKKKKPQNLVKNLHFLASLARSSGMLETCFEDCMLKIF